MQSLHSKTNFYLTLTRFVFTITTLDDPAVSTTNQTSLIVSIPHPPSVFFHFTSPNALSSFARASSPANLSNAVFAWSGTTALPRHLILSTREGTPSTTRRTLGSTAHQSFARGFSAPLCDSHFLRAPSVLPRPAALATNSFEPLSPD